MFRKKDSRFYWYDFKVRGKRYRGSTKETNKKRAGKIAALRFSQAIEGTSLLDRRAPSLQELSTRFRGCVESAGLASKTRKYYANGWRLLSSKPIVGMRLDHITKDHVEALRFGSSAANVNCALRTLRRMLHKGEEWNLLIKVPRFKLWPEHGRKLRLDGDAESNKCIVREDGRIGKSAARSRTQAKTIIRQVVENMIRTEEIRLRVTNGRLVVNSQ